MSPHKLYIALGITVRTLIKAEKLMHVNFCLLPLASCLARSAIAFLFEM
ncbi:MAG: hypothetical protein F6K56_39490 [Moorea sp. SIO3G5]|nr:hypothetical protein [Moorena sp. SIO3G5]